MTKIPEKIRLKVNTMYSLILFVTLGLSALPSKMPIPKTIVSITDISS
ncbi:hypothetical protein BAG01nite_10970 [Brevibacillus agri]|uniref:Uncharacterized protein n=1 Tax=Brevibacillus agri TaxID=51101 RepID=A0ABQ0SMI4_9BACL|nr:hypothetical protein BAG01nite_10970 [Brevibacillus agri]